MIWIMLWLAIGLISGIICLYIDYRDGMNVAVASIGYLMVLTISGIVTTIVLLDRHGCFDKVLIKGKKK